MPTQTASPVLLMGSSLAAAAPADAGAGAATAVATTAVNTAAATVATATATFEPPMCARPSGPPVPYAPAQRRAARDDTAAQLLSSRSQRDPERVKLLALLPGRPIVADICVTHPLAVSAVKAADRDTGATDQG